MTQRKNDYENSDDREPTTERSANDPYDERMYGNVWTRLWLNRDPRGKKYLTFSQHRVYEQDGVSGITKSFRITDLDDVIRGAQWVSGRVIIRKTALPPFITIAPVAACPTSWGKAWQKSPDTNESFAASSATEISTF